jgi:NAD(P)-dependent dehydrogenase (short-subunit alcohol dehydrogenase family)
MGSRLLDGKVVVVSGVGPGLGYQVATAAAAAGASVVLGARNDGYLSEVEAEIAATGGAAAASRCDVTSAADCQALIETAVERFGRLDCLVNNAYATGPMTVPVAEADFDDWRQAFDVTLFGSLRLTQAAVAVMREQGDGSVIFVGSQIVRRVLPGRGSYAAGKAALLAAAQVLAREVGEDGIRVNTIVPGRMWGPNLQRWYETRAAERGVTVEEELAPVRELIALGDIPSDADVAGAVLFLASDLSIAMTGQTVDVNGGETFN